MILEDNLAKLEETRKKLLDQAIELRNALNKYGESSQNNKRSINLNKVATNEERVSAENLDEIKNATQLVELTQSVTGINYRNINKKWLEDNIWQYKTTVEMKELKFKLEVTVDQQKQGENEIVDITCHFNGTEIGCLQEISSWVLALTKIKNLSFLMSVFSDYNHQCTVRRKILNKLKSKNIVTVENCQDERGGIITSVHSSKSVDKFYVTYLWRTEFTPKTETISHVFTIENIDDGFLNANRELIKSFCKKPLNKDQLEELWNNLCIAVDEYTQ